MQPLVSVIFPAYNHEKYVQDTIKSITAQTYQNIELIIIDDGSTDSTYQKMLEMKEECEKRFTRVVFETQENKGVNYTLNKLKKLAQGEYILSTASDDMLKSQCIEKEIDFLMQNPDYVLCACDDEIIDSESKICYWDKNRNIIYDEQKAQYKTFTDFLKKERKEIDFNSEDFGSYYSLYFGNYIPNGFLRRTNISNMIGEYPEEVLEDWWFLLQLSKYGKFKYFDEPLYQYRWHNNNTIKNKQKIKEMFFKTRQYEINYLNMINEKNQFNQFLPVIKELYENGIERTAINYFNIIKIKTKHIPAKNIKEIKIEILGIKIYSYTKSI
ncbi:MAG: glycosyltransferase family 2 protein [Candidatus Gastranaerophilaceae bacterium]